MESSDQTAKLENLLTSIKQLGDSMTLNREKAKTTYINITKSGFDELSMIISIALIKQMFNSRRWEDRHGAIQASLVLLDLVQESSETSLKDRFRTFVEEDLALD
jgi:hypothetical protein